MIKFTHFRGDLFGGITAGIVALPLALAFGEQSGLGASAGLYGAAFVAFFAALFGGTATQISGPTAPMTVLSATVVAGIVAAKGGDLDQAIPLILMVFMLAGIFQIVLGLLKAGAVIRFIPRTVVSGFMTGIGVIILVTQFLPSIGYYAEDDPGAIHAQLEAAEHLLVQQAMEEAEGDFHFTLDDLPAFIDRTEVYTAAHIEDEARTLAQSASKGVLGSLRTIPRALYNISWVELLLCLLTIAIIYGFKRITTAIPSALVALLVVTTGAVFSGVIYRPVSGITGGFPLPHFEMFGTIGDLLPYVVTALILALLGAIDSLLTSIVADNMTRTQHSSNRELIGQGIGNSIAAIFGGLPGAGATIRTVVNIQAGGKTRLSGMIAGLLLFTMIIALGPVASLIPNAVLSGVLITVGIGVMDYRGLRELKTMPKADRLVLLTVLALTVFWQLVFAVAVGLILAALLFMHKMSQWTSGRFAVAKWQKTHDDDSLDGDVWVKHIHGPLFFGNVAEFSSLRSEIPEGIKKVRIEFSEVAFIDQSGMYALEESILHLSMSECEITLNGLDDEKVLQLKSFRIVPDLVPNERVFKAVE